MKRTVVSLLIVALLTGFFAFSADAASATSYEVGYSKVDINPYWHEWVKWSGNPPSGIKGVIPYAFYDPYDLMPLPMGGYGNNDTRLSRPKLMDDNGSGIGAGTTNVTSAYVSGKLTTLNKDKYYADVYLGIGTQNKNNNTAKNYQDVHLSSNRYTKAFAKEMGVTYADGIYGENDGDGVWVNCVAIKDPQTGTYLLMISVDNIGIPDTLIKDYIKPQIVRQCKGVTTDRILINSNHTHGSVSLGTQYSSSDTTTRYYLANNDFGDQVSFTEQQCHWYLKFYKNFLIDKITEAASKAIADMETALTMEKGSIDTSEQTGYQLNGVRHNVQTYSGTGSTPKKSSITYVRGSSFNNDIDPKDGVSYDTHFAGNQTGMSASTPVSESDDSLHILKFTFKNKAPIAMVNFRAHSTANNKETAKALHYNISADWVSPLRYEMEQNGYRFSLLYGSSGNLGTAVSSDTNSIIPYNQAYYSASDGYWVLPATHYGRKLAEASLALLGDITQKSSAIITQMHSVAMGKIQSSQTIYIPKKQQWSALAYAASLKYHADGASNGRKYTFSDGATVTYGTSSITLKSGEGGSFVVASKFHAKNIKSKYEATGTSKVELNTIKLGNAVAFATTPMEASDRYFSQEILSTTSILPNASNYNDWDLLVEDEAWGTPFVLSLTNGSRGYIPNQLAYDYNRDYTGTEYTLAVGSYESHTSWADRGEGEKIVATLNNMLRGITPRDSYCQHCGETVTWQPLGTDQIELITQPGASVSTYMLPGGHYYIPCDQTHNRQTRIDEKVCLDLNGFTYTAQVNAYASRAFTVNGTLNIMDSSASQTGTLQGCGVQLNSSNANFSGGTIMINEGGLVNLYSGTLTQNTGFSEYGTGNGGVISTSGQFNMYGGTVYGGAATAKGGNIYISGGSVTLTQGTVRGGTAANAGNIYLDSGALTIAGASVENGTSTGNGGNIYVGKSGTLELLSGQIKDGRAEKENKTLMGGNVYSEGSFLMAGGNISGGYAQAYGGNVHIQNSPFTMIGGTITGGYAVTGKGNDLCTGKSGTGMSNFRMEGGFVGQAYIQGNVVLTGTTQGKLPMYVYIKEPENRLSIEGTYTGMVHIILNGDQYENLPAGSQIGNAKNADIQDAQITIEGYPKMHAAVNGSKLILEESSVAIRVGFTTTHFDTLDAAIEHYNTLDKGWLVLNTQNLDIAGVTRDLKLDLNGCNVATIDVGEHKLICMDSATNDFSSPGPGSYGSIPADLEVICQEGYIPVTQNGRTSFHRLDMAITSVNLRPRNAGIYYSCLFRGDEVLKANVRQFGVSVCIGDAANAVWINAGKDGAEWTTGYGSGINSVLVKDILKQTCTDEENLARGETRIHAKAYVILNDGSALYGDTISYSIRDILEVIDRTHADLTQGLTELYAQYAAVMERWNLPNFKATTE